MKAKNFRKLRKRLGALQTFTIRETFGLFGDFFGHDYGHTMSDNLVSATSYQRAIKIYMRNYRKRYKKKNEHENEEYIETTENWGRIMVKNECGFMKFFK